MVIVMMADVGSSSGNGSKNIKYSSSGVDGVSSRNSGYLIVIIYYSIVGCHRSSSASSSHLCCCCSSDEGCC